MRTNRGRGLGSLLSRGNNQWALSHRAAASCAGFQIGLHSFPNALLTNTRQLCSDRTVRASGANGASEGKKKSKKIRSITVRDSLENVHPGGLRACGVAARARRVSRISPCHPAPKRMLLSLFCLAEDATMPPCSEDVAQHSFPAEDVTISPNKAEGTLL
ncbi:hypothetical protein C0J45_10458 [Silurus meridionalis]|nr:hypothetical protein C0J45_10458 [Silurus meridionalis]